MSDTNDTNDTTATNFRFLYQALCRTIIYICEFAWDGNDVHLSGVGKLEHGARLILARVLQDDDRMLAGCRLQDVPEVRRHRGEDHLVRIQGAPVRAR